MSRRCTLRLLLTLGVVVASGGVATAKDASRAESIELPAPCKDGTKSLEEVLALRRSRRTVSSEPLAIETIGQLLWAAQGITLLQKGFRTAPSAGARYPLRLYVLLPNGVYAYKAKSHTLVRTSSVDVRKPFWREVYSRPRLAVAPVMFVIAADSRKTEEKYGRKAARFVHIEAGHAAQNLLLQSASLGLVGLGVGAFHEVRTHKILGLPVHEEILYVLPIGKPPR